jgi:hypothetical protein
VDKAQKLNPDLTFIEEIRSLYKQMVFLWNKQNGEGLEAIGGGFNITLAALQDKDRRSKIAIKIREFAERTDQVIDVFSNQRNSPKKGSWPT